MSNSVGGKYVGGARWLGVPLMDILDKAGVGGNADQLLATDFDGMTIGTPLDLVTDGREPLVVVGMNGEQLPREHGFPVRIVIPGLYGFISATKWVTKLTLTTYADQDSYWTERNWDTRAPIKPSARIDTPKGLSTVDGGKVIIGGVAWAQDNGGASKVQIKLDGGEWGDASGPDVNNVYWRQWFHEADLDAGQHTVAARVVDGDGETQTDVKAQPFPGRVQRHPLDLLHRVVTTVTTIGAIACTTDQSSTTAGPNNPSKFPYRKAATAMNLQILRRGTAAAAVPPCPSPSPPAARTTSPPAAGATTPPRPRRRSPPRRRSRPPRSRPPRTTSSVPCSAPPATRSPPTVSPAR